MIASVFARVETLKRSRLKPKAAFHQGFHIHSCCSAVPAGHCGKGPQINPIIHHLLVLNLHEVCSQDICNQTVFILMFAFEALTNK